MELFVIDNGASTFIPLWSYIVENQVIDILREAGKRLYVHTVITGGQALLDTVNGFRSLAQSTTDQNVIVWINEYFGRVERDGKTFPDMAAYTENADKVLGSVHIPKRNPDTFGRDVEDVISRKLTFEEAIANGAFSIMTKQRLRVVQRDLFEQLDAHRNLMIDQKRLIGEVAAKNGIRLEPDDPAFALVTLNETVLQDASAALTQEIRAVSSELCRSRWRKRRTGQAKRSRRT